MRFVTVRDFRNHSAQIKQYLNEEKDMIITSNGKPFAILSLTSEKGFENTLALIRRIRAESAVVSMQKKSIEKGINKLSLKQINNEIKIARKKFKP